MKIRKRNILKMGLGDLSNKTVKELKALCKEEGIVGYSSMTKDKLIRVLRGDSSEESGKKKKKKEEEFDITKLDEVNLEDVKVPGLKSICRQLGIERFSKATKPELIALINDKRNTEDLISEEEESVLSSESEKKVKSNYKKKQKSEDTDDLSEF